LCGIVNFFEAPQCKKSCSTLKKKIIVLVESISKLTAF
jgi:hypothetical protein